MALHHADPVIDEISGNKQTGFLQEVQRGTFNLLQHIIPPFNWSHFLTLGSPSRAPDLVWFSIRHPGFGVMCVAGAVPSFFFQEQMIQLLILISFNCNKMAALDSFEKGGRGPRFTGGPEGPSQLVCNNCLCERP